MNTLQLNPTAVAQWTTLITEAEKACKLQLGEDLESYLVFLLMRYLRSPEIGESLIALEYLSGMELSGYRQEAQLTTVGDKCLLFSGLFPGRAERRRLRISYYARIGISAYAFLAETLRGAKAKLYAQLAEQFITVVDTLHIAQELNRAQPILQPLQAMEFWEDTHSQHAYATLRRYTSGFPLRLGNNSLRQ